MKYDHYSVEPDFLKRRKHIYYLLGHFKPNCADVIGSYSIKSKQLLIKCANDHIPPKDILDEFVRICESKGEAK